MNFNSWTILSAGVILASVAVLILLGFKFLVGGTRTRAERLLRAQEMYTGAS